MSFFQFLVRFLKLPILDLNSIISKEKEVGTYTPTLLRSKKEAGR